MNIVSYTQSGIITNQKLAAEVELWSEICFPLFSESGKRYQADININIHILNWTEGLFTLFLSQLLQRTKHSLIIIFTTDACYLHSEVYHLPYYFHLQLL